MALSYLVVPLCLISASLIGYSQCQDFDTLTQFGTDVRKRISNENFKKIFTVKSGSNEKVNGAIEKGDADFFKKLGIPYDKSIVQGVEKQSMKLPKKIPPKQLFQAQTNALSKFLSDKGILNADNVGRIAQKYANELNKSAMSENGDDITAEVDAIATALGNFFKSVGVTSNKSILQFNKDLFQELEKNQKKGGGLLGGLLSGLLGGLLGGNGGNLLGGLLGGNGDNGGNLLGGNGGNGDNDGNGGNLLGGLLGGNGGGLLNGLLGGNGAGLLGGLLGGNGGNGDNDGNGGNLLGGLLQGNGGNGDNDGNGGNLLGGLLGGNGGGLLGGLLNGLLGGKGGGLLGGLLGGGLLGGLLGGGLLGGLLGGGLGGDIQVGVR